MWNSYGIGGDWMKKKNSTVCLICGFVSMAITILFYILTFENIFNIPIRWLSLLFLLIIEVMATIKALKVPNTIMGTSIILLNIIYLGIVLVLSLVFVNLFPLFIKKYVLINLLLIAIVAIVDVVLMFFSDRAEDNNMHHSSVTSVIDECVVKASELLFHDTTDKYKTDIEEIVDMLKYSNKAMMCGCEMDILSGLEEAIDLINTDSADEVVKQLSKVKKLIKLRSIQIKKAGKF